MVKSSPVLLTLESQATKLTINPPTPDGGFPPFTVYLSGNLSIAATGTGVSNVAINIYRDGDLVATVITDNNGTWLYNETVTSKKTVPTRGDFNGDYIINQLDLDMLNAHIGTSDPLYDLNNDGVVDTDDVTLFSMRWLWHPWAYNYMAYFTGDIIYAGSQSSVTWVFSNNIPTAITINVSPTSGRVPLTITVSGVLTVSPTAGQVGGFAGATVRVLVGGSFYGAEAVTDDMGNYSRTVTVTLPAGGYDVETEFLGDKYFAGCEG